MLDVGFQPAVVVGDELFRIGAEIAVRVAGEPQVGRFGDQHTVRQHFERARQHQLVEEHRLLVHPPVIIEILEDADPSERLALAGRGDVRHVAEHLDYPHASIRIEVDEHGLFDHRLARDELDVVSGREEEPRHLVFRRAHG